MGNRTEAAGRGEASHDGEVRLKVLLALASELDPLDDPARTARVVSRVVAEALEADRGFYVAVDGAAGGMRVVEDCVRDGGSSIAGDNAVETHGWSLEALRRGEPSRVGEVRVVARAPGEGRPASTGLGNVVGLVAPLVTEGTLVGVLCVTSARRRSWTEGEVSVLRDAADRVLTAIVASQSEKPPAEDEALFRTFADSMDEAVCVVERPAPRPDGSRDLRYVSMNRAMRTLFGIPDLTGRSILDGLPDEAEDWLDDCDHVLDTGRPLRIERALTSRGPVLDVSLRRIERGSRPKLLAVIRDVTERRHAEEALRERENRAFLLELSDELRPLGSATDIQSVAMRRLAERLGVVRAGYYEVAADQDAFTLTARWERPGSLPLPDRMFLEDYGPDLSERYRAGRTLIIRDTETDAATADNRAAFRAIEARAWIGAPLVKEGRLIGGVGVQSAVPRDWTPAEIRLVEDVAERTWAADAWARAEAAVRDREQRLRALVDATSAVVYSMSPDWSAMERLEVRGRPTGAPVPGRTWLERYIPPEDRETVTKHVREAVRDGTAFELEHAVRCEDGSHGWVASSAVPIRDARGEIVEWFGAARDVTEYRRALAQLSEQQRLEVVGRLSGAMAHDFNNQLLVIMNNVQLAQLKAVGAEGGPYLEAALKAAEVGKSLVKRLVVWAGKNDSRPRRLELNAVVGEMSAMVSRMLEDRIAFGTDLADDLWPASVDPVDLDNAILNLALNARDATADAGEIAMATANVTWTEDDPRRPARATPGDYVCLSVSDTGSGMTEAVRARAFEPFFTTKSHGTGLGLFGIRETFERQGGLVDLESEPGRGTCVRVYVPRSVDERSGHEAPPAREVRGSPATLLLVEDDPAVRRSARRLVEAVGYRVVEATDASDALATLEARDDVRLVMSDISMPGPMDGRDLARRLRAERPDLAVVLTTGFDVGADSGAGRDADSGAVILAKPYRIAELERALSGAVAGA